MFKVRNMKETTTVMPLNLYGEQQYWQILLYTDSRSYGK